jgi:hypothetical protein
MAKMLQPSAALVLLKGVRFAMSAIYHIHFKKESQSFCSHVFQTQAFNGTEKNCSLKHRMDWEKLSYLPQPNDKMLYRDCI